MGPVRVARKVFEGARGRARRLGLVAFLNVNCYLYHFPVCDVDPLRYLLRSCRYCCAKCNGLVATVTAPTAYLSPVGRAHGLGLDLLPTVGAADRQSRHAEQLVVVANGAARGGNTQMTVPTKAKG